MKGSLLIFKVIIPLIVSAFVKGLSPSIRAFLSKTVNDLDKKARATPNPFDDALVDILKSVIPPNGL